MSKGRELYWAVARNDVGAVERLIKEGAEVNWVNGDVYDWTPLHRAAERGHKDAALLLLQAGAEVDKGDRHGRSPLHRAAREGKADVAQVLLVWGADPKKASNGGSTPLSNAQKYGHSEIVAMLQDGGAEVFRQHFAKGGVCGPGVLAAAARTKRHQVVSLILDNTKLEHLLETLSYIDNSGKNALAWAVENHSASTIDLILQKGCTVDAVLGCGLATAAKLKQHQFVQLILQNTKPVHPSLIYKDKSGKTALEWAVQNGDKFLISDLLRHEYEFHDDKESGLRCLKTQLTYEANLTAIQEQFTDQYKKSTWQKRKIGLIALLPVLLHFSQINAILQSSTFVAATNQFFARVVGGAIEVCPRVAKQLVEDHDEDTAQYP